MIRADLAFALEHIDAPTRDHAAKEMDPRTFDVALSIVAKDTANSLVKSKAAHMQKMSREELQSEVDKWEHSPRA